MNQQQPVAPLRDEGEFGARDGEGSDFGQSTVQNGAQRPAIPNDIRSGGRKRPKKKTGCFVILLVIAIIAIALSVSNCIKDAPKPMDWPDTGLATLLPDPPHDKGEIASDSDTFFSADIDLCTAEDYSDYVAACSEKGFAIEAESDTTAYRAFNSEGYKLSLSYWESKERIDVSVEAPEKMGDFSWPTSGPASLVPAPASTTGSVDVDTSERFAIYVGNTSKDDLHVYADECAAAGFSVDYDSGETWYRAENKDGDSLELSYMGFNVMKVDISLHGDSSVNDDANGSDSSEGETEAARQSESDATSGVTPEFKATMDEYEAFFDEYIEFMEKYAESDDVVAMAADYADMMQQYSETMDAMSAIDEDSLSDADLAYYLEVTSRINEKLLEISY